MEDIEVTNAIIKSTVLSFEERGCLDFWVYVDHSGGTQGFGGYNLHSKTTTVKPIAGEYIYRVLEVAGVTNFDKLKGRAIRIRLERGLIVSIGHIVNNDWFTPADFYKE